MDHRPARIKRLAPVPDQGTQDTPGMDIFQTGPVSPGQRDKAAVRVLTL